MRPMKVCVVGNALLWERIVAQCDQVGFGQEERVSHALS
ncbi:hypothetical protein C770_GR4pC0452 (plasmid) [Sinorhizobium meliloti GR4]|nr:hypothetical protein C770_GR4pC0452 [Sinorhizobium meliloti GR4]